MRMPPLFASHHRSSLFTPLQQQVEYSLLVKEDSVIYTCPKAEFRLFLDEYPSVLLMLLKAGTGIIL